MATQQDLDALAEIIEDSTAINEEPIAAAPTLLPPPTEVELPLGLWSPVEPGVRDIAVVRELNGHDEEVISRSASMGAVMQTLLERAVVSIGDKPVTPSDLNELCTGDRMELLLGIRQVTWGEEVESYSQCPTCETINEKDVLVEDIPRHTVDDKIKDRQFRVELRKGEALLNHPSGALHKQVLLNKFETAAELTTATIVDCAVDIPGMLIINREAVRNMALKDRQALLEAVGDHPVGPDLDTVPVTCDKCGEEYTLALSAGALFPF